jgi:hypothetical protein
MSADRILGQHVELHVYSKSFKKNIIIGEIDSCSATDKAKVIEHQPLGQTVPRSQLVPGGWELALKGGKINGALAAEILNRDAHLNQGKASPRYDIIVTTTYFDGSTDDYAYCDCVLHGFKSDVTKADAEIGEDFTATATWREGRGAAAMNNVAPNMTPNTDYGVSSRTGK